MAGSYNGYEYLRALLRGEEEINGSRSLCLSLSRIVIGWFIRDRVRVVKLWIQFLFSFSALFFFFFFFSFLSIYSLFHLIIWQWVKNGNYGMACFFVLVYGWFNRLLKISLTFRSFFIFLVCYRFFFLTKHANNILRKYYFIILLHVFDIN